MPPRKPPPGNPLWISWLKEWEKEMSEKSENMPRAIRRAIKSFEQCPVPIQHPANANTLQNVGDKTIQYLTKRLKKYCQDNQLPMPEPVHTNFEHEAAKAIKKKRKRSAVDEANEEDAAAVAGLFGMGAPSDSDEEDRPINTSPMKRPKKQRAYAPRVRSGPWAILIGLASYGVEAWKSQDEIIARADPFFGEEGQSLKDKSNVGSGAGQFFTGWSSSKTLFNKGFLEKRSRNPVQYTITRTGWKIARRAVRNAKRKNDIDFDARRKLPEFETDSDGSASEDGASDAENQPVASTSRAKASTSVAAGRTQAKGKGKAVAVGADTIVDEPTTVSDPPRRSMSGHGVSDPTNPTEQKRVNRRDLADINMDAQDYTPIFFIEFRQCQAKHVFAKKNISEPLPIFRGGPLGPEGPTYSAYLPAKYAPDSCPTFDSLKSMSSMSSIPDKQPPASSSLSPKRPSLSQTSSRTLSRETILPDQPEESSPRTNNRKFTAIVKVPAHIRPKDPANKPEEYRGASGTSPNIAMRTRVLQAAEARRDAVTSSSSPFKSDIKGKSKAQQPNAFDVLQAGAAAAAARARQGDNISFPNVEMTVTPEGAYIPDMDYLTPVKMAPGTYTVHLIIDTREKPGLSSKKLELLLTEKGIPWEARTLSMGDAIWIARCRSSGLEVVLDACLERKRLDDLLSSLRDGRYMEQKNRMVQSGITRLMYLVEEYDSKKAMDTWGRQIWTMKSSLQVVDNFTVHIAWNLNDVFGYLARLTKTFQEVYKDVTLTILPDECISKVYHLDFMRHLAKTYPSACFLTSLKAYQIINSKQHSVHTGWAKMIASINQMSLANTERFLSKWPTPAAFFAELEKIKLEDATLNARAAEEEALDPFALKRKKREEPKLGECWIMRQTSSQDENGETVRAIGQALSTHCWKLFTSEKY